MSTQTMILSIAGALLMLTVGCQRNNPEPSATPAADVASSEKPGAQLWAENCGRCHNIRPPGSFDDAQWETIVQHMRLRADLTGVEARKITEFLKASH
jgi:mono/diheme cytochrome c family protein